MVLLATSTISQRWVYRHVLCAVCVLSLGISCTWGEDVKCKASADGCSCSFSDGSGVVDVSSLSHSDGTPRFKDTEGPDGNFYSYNPCDPFSEGDCSGAAVCQRVNGSNTFTQIGDANTARWMVQNNYTTILVYDHMVPGVVDRQSYVTYLCDASAKDPVFNVTSVDPTQVVFYFTLTTKCACPNGCSGSSGGSPGSDELGAGSIFLIVVCALVFAYLVVGVAFKRVVYGASGVQMIPNIDFWRSLPQNIKDGFLWLTCQKKRETYDGI